MRREGYDGDRLASVEGSDVGHAPVTVTGKTYLARESLWGFDPTIKNGSGNLVITSDRRCR